MEATHTSPIESAPSTGSAGDWKSLALHRIQCPSGMWVRIRIPNLAALLETDAVPVHLVNIALRELVDPGSVPTAPAEEGEGPRFDLEMVKQMAELTRYLVLQAVVEPKLAEADLAEIPQEDVDMLIAIAQRMRVYDARGVRLGVEPLARFELWRNKHGCTADCPACRDVQSQFSTH